MAKKILIIQGHPDNHELHFGNAIADAYEIGAKESGRAVKSIQIAKLSFPLIRSQKEFESDDVPADIRESQQAIRWADHILILYPLWLGTMPALLKGFFEQVFRPGFAMDMNSPKKLPKGLLKGKSARIVVTMGMPAFVYRWFFFAHSVKSLERSVLSLAGIGPIKMTLIGMVEAMKDADRKQWLAKIRALGAQGN